MNAGGVRIAVALFALIVIAMSSLGTAPADTAPAAASASRIAAPR